MNDFLKDKKVALSVENVTMQFGGVVAVNNLTMHLPENSITALIGPNGAGKTTAFNCITGVYQPTNGVVKFYDKTIVSGHPVGKDAKSYKGWNAELYLNEPIIDPTPDEITKLGIARTFQNIRLWKSMSVFDNVLIAKHMRAKQNVFSATFRGNAKEEKRMREETAALLEEQNLYQYKDELATSLPYGLQRRLEIARALATDPKLLLLDEPAAGMNPQETLELASFIKQIREKYNLTIFLIEHHMDLVMGIADYIHVIDFGSEIAQGYPEEIQANQKVIDAYLGVSEDE